ncbi:CPBP family intramembrane glutamic endopeptidase [Rossellomorea sp. KS-H15a]|uniref:CPBP family intramembrane glutamic endopeptidase n=1 Tax=Rossellomorea sp. KS-H15a TaxID=2963940 RepID=UPI0020C6E25C|nr:type II CAAX endopeptidase family protein [Rossellomorea sp. KS-H15a]UTE76840.1 CPBP family intramembrane metalloprotease [Rossellomorea sp. KS-H15a]
MLNSSPAHEPIPVTTDASNIRFKTLLIYLTMLALPGYVINQLPLQNYDGLKGLIWFLYFMAVTLGYKNIRTFIVPLLKVEVFKKPETYLWIFLTFMLPYVLLHVSLHFEVLIDKYYIFYFNNHMLHASSWRETVDVAVLTPISEEIIFRGILLTVLLKFVKPFWAVGITSILFGLIHPSEIWLFTVLAGFLLTMTAYKTKSILPAMVAHSMWNLYMVQLFLFF